MNYLEAEASLGAARADRRRQGGTTVADCDEYSNMFKGRGSGLLVEVERRSLSAIVLTWLLCAGLFWLVCVCGMNLLLLVLIRHVESRCCTAAGGGCSWERPLANSLVSESSIATTGNMCMLTCEGIHFAWLHDKVSDQCDKKQEFCPLGTNEMEPVGGRVWTFSCTHGQNLK